MYSVAVHHGFDMTGGSPVSVMLMHFAQFLDHDLSLTAEQDRECCDPVVVREELNQPENRRYCFNIDISEDQFYSSKGETCFPFSRSENDDDDDEYDDDKTGRSPSAPRRAPGRTSTTSPPSSTVVPCTGPTWRPPPACGLSVREGLENILWI